MMSLSFKKLVGCLASRTSAAALAVFLSAAPAGAITLTFFPASAYNPTTSIMDATLGLAGFTIDDFETLPFIPGLTLTISGNGVPLTTYSSLPSLLDTVTQCGPVLGGGPWDGSHMASNLLGNTLNSCATPTGLAKFATFDYAPGATSFGIGLANFQSLTASIPITNHELFVNGVDMGVVETLAGANWTPGTLRNTYLLISGGLITSVGFENLTAADYLAFDHLAVQHVTSTAPEPSSIALLGIGLLALARRFRRH
jgi:hypothetical protein